MASSPEKLETLLHSLETILKPRQRVCVCAAFLDRIHYLNEAVELLATGPLNAYMVVTKYLDGEVNRGADPQKSAAFYPREQICGDP